MSYFTTTEHPTLWAVIGGGGAPIYAPTFEPSQQIGKTYLHHYCLPPSNYTLALYSVYGYPWYGGSLEVLAFGTSNSLGGPFTITDLNSL